MRFSREPPPPANDNAAGRTSPAVRVARGRSKAVYAASDGVILPLRFAARMHGWRGASPVARPLSDGAPS